MPVVSAHLLVVRAVGRVRRPQRDDDVAGFRAVVVGAGEATAAAALGAGERRERQWWVVGVRVLGVPPPVADHTDDDGHQQEEGRAPRCAGDEGDVGGLQGSVLAATFPAKAVGPSGVGGVPRVA